MINNNWLAWASKLVVLSVLLSCSSSSFNDDDYGLDLQTCSANTQKEFVHKALQDRYYWYQEIASNVNYSDFTSPTAVLKHLRYKPDEFDHYSFITSSSSFDSFYDEGQFVGFGFGFDRDTAYLRLVYNNSPFGQAGFKRGDKIISIDGVLTSTIIANDSWNDVFGAATVGVSRAFVIEHQDNSQTSNTLSKAVVTINTVLAAETFSQSGRQYAYLAFKNFISPSYGELKTAFEKFTADGAEKLILDLRDNGGGSIAVAAALASYIHKPDIDNTDIFTSLKFNNKYKSENYSFFFQQINNSLDLDEVIILTTERSCSASEMVINALDPYINVTVIGSTTCGKPIGMRSQSFCNNELVAINFQGFNSANFGDYFNGLPADCAAQDDLNFELGDINELMLKAALDFDQSEICVVSKTDRISSAIKPSLYQGLKREYASE